MMHREAEAKTKWCPFARVTTYDKHAIEFAAGQTVGMTAANKQSDGTVRTGAHCIASACMAWRWDTLPMDGAPDQDIAARWGHCGLAGAVA